VAVSAIVEVLRQKGTVPRRAIVPARYYPLATGLIGLYLVGVTDGLG
jgi:hypothetical protein